MPSIGRLLVIAIASSAPLAFAVTCETKELAQYKEEARDGDVGPKTLAARYCTYSRLEKIALDAGRNNRDTAASLEMLGAPSKADAARNAAQRSDAEATQCYRERTKMLIALQSSGSAAKPACKR